MISCTNLSIYFEEKQIIKGLDWSSQDFPLWIVLGPNGAGKSTFLHSLAGVINSDRVEGIVRLDGEDITDLSVFDRFHKGVMIAYQNPPEIEGLSIIQLLTTILKEKNLQKGLPAPNTFDVVEQVKEVQKLLDLPEDFYTRMVHSGLSGGQKKLLELLQILVVQPKYVLLDEIDSGLDVIKQKIIQKAIQFLISQGSVVVYITHSLALAKEFTNARFIVLIQGEKKTEGGIEIVNTIQEYGFKPFVR